MSLPTTYQAYPPFDAQAARLRTRFGIALDRTPEESYRRIGRYDVHLDTHRPEGRARGTALLVHGAGAHGRLLAAFAAPLVAAGLSVLAPDLPGYGLTRGPTAQATYPEWIEIVTALGDEAAAEGPVFFFGLSVGGLTALRASQRARAAAGVIATTLLDLHDPHRFDAAARAPLLGRLARVGFRSMPTLLDRVALPLTWLAPLELLTSDRELAALLCADPLLGRRRVALRLFRSLHSFTPGPDDATLRCPLLLVHPGADRWTPLALSRPLFDALEGDKRLVLLSGGEHAPLETPAFRELSRVLGEFVAERLAALGR
jgi:alpha-beta hydrolase superfamily lysophospholipase